jgi:uncharacterized protein YpbB
MPKEMLLKILKLRLAEFDRFSEYEESQRLRNAANRVRIIRDKPPLDYFQYRLALLTAIVRLEGTIT